MVDRREELGLDSDGLSMRHCARCASLVEVRTYRDDLGSKHYSCAQCGSELGIEAAGSFDAPEPSDA